MNPHLYVQMPVFHHVDLSSLSTCFLRQNICNLSDAVNYWTYSLPATMAMVTVRAMEPFKISAMQSMSSRQRRACTWSISSFPTRLLGCGSLCFGGTCCCFPGTVAVWLHLLCFLQPHANIWLSVLCLDTVMAFGGTLPTHATKRHDLLQVGKNCICYSFCRRMHESCKLHCVSCSCPANQ